MNLLREWIRQVLLIEGRKEDLLSKNPDLKDQIEFFSTNDPSGNLKYLDWQLRMFKSGIVKQEIIDVTNTFHRFGSQLAKKDINQYKPSEFMSLKDQLFDIEARQDAKKEKVDKRYRLDDVPDADVVYDSENWTVHLIKNKAASMKIGCNTKWCTTTKNELHFENYIKQNVVFFYVLSKKLIQSNPNYKIACAVHRDKNNEIIDNEWYNSLDKPLTNKTVIKIFGAEFNEINNIINNIAIKYPKSQLARLESGELSSKEMQPIYDEALKIKDLDTLKKVLISNQLTLDSNSINKILGFFISKNKKEFWDVKEIVQNLQKVNKLSDDTIRYLMSYKKIDLDYILMSLRSISLDLFKEIYKRYTNETSIIFNSARDPEVIQYLFQHINDRTKVEYITTHLDKFSENFVIEFYQKNKNLFSLMNLVREFIKQNVDYKKLIEIIYSDIKNNEVAIRSEDQRNLLYEFIVENNNTPQWIIDEIGKLPK